MSATGRSEAAGTGVVRHPDDFYATPAWATRALIPALGTIVFDQVMIDPCCGDGAILDVLATDVCHAHRRLGIEIDHARAEHAREMHNVKTRDALGPEPWFSDLPEWPPPMVITNPPFSLALDFARRAIAEVGDNGTVVMLLRLNWLASQKRAAWMRAHTPSVYVLPKRPSFTGKGTDATEYAWMVWRKGDISRVQILEVTS